MRSVYFGGGTPSLLGPDGVRDLVDRIRRHVRLDDAEITLEVNPEDVTPAATAAWRDAGINRISIGVQSLSDAALEWMHRVHNAERAREALSILTGAFDRVSADLIFALPAAVERNLAADAGELLAAGVGHISIYGLTAEPRTPYARWIDRGQSFEAGEEAYETEFLELDRTFSAAGFEHYEVSSFARPGQRSTHNSAYWSGAAYVGIGPAAHGFDGSVRRWNVAEFEKWLERAEAGEDPIADEETLTAGNRVAEEVYLGLRVAEGLRLVGNEHATVQRWLSSGWGNIHGGVLRLSPLGWLRLDSLAALLTASRSR